MTAPVSVFEAFGGKEVQAYSLSAWGKFVEFVTEVHQNPPGCYEDSQPFSTCHYFCDDQGCDQVHPNFAGNIYFAEFIYNTVNWTVQSN